MFFWISAWLLVLELQNVILHLSSLHLIKSAMDTIFKFSASANWRSLGNLAMEPSSSTISQRTATGSSPANTARSTEASVWPALFSTPPSLYLSGKMCPGRLKSSGFESADAKAKTVFALSRADTPVVVPYFASYQIQLIGVNGWEKNVMWTLNKYHSNRPYSICFWLLNTVQLKPNYKLQSWQVNKRFFTPQKQCNMIGKTTDLDHYFKDYD